MPIFQFEPPTSNLPDFILYIWQCMGKETLSIPDLKFFLSFRAKLMSPSKAQAMIDAALQSGLLVNKNNFLVLPETLQKRKVEQEKAEKERIQQMLKQQARKEKAKTSKTYSDYLREILPDEYKNKTYLIHANDIELEVRDFAAESIRGTIKTEGEKPIEVVIEGKSFKIVHSCDFLTPQYKSAVKFCPHIGAVFRNLSNKHPDLANNLIRSMVEKKDKWHFA